MSDDRAEEIRHLQRCPCGQPAFLVITEKLYAASVDAEGVLACREQSEFVKTIACSRRGREFGAIWFQDGGPLTT